MDQQLDTVLNGTSRRYWRIAAGQLRRTEEAVASFPGTGLLVGMLLGILLGIWIKRR